MTVIWQREPTQPEKVERIRVFANGTRAQVTVTRDYRKLSFVIDAVSGTTVDDRVPWEATEEQITELTSPAQLQTKLLTPSAQAPDTR